MYVMTPEYGASTQLEKIDMLDYADLVALNKSDKRGALDALQAVRKQFQRNHFYGKAHWMICRYMQQKHLSSMIMEQQNYTTDWFPKSTKIC
jgi:putative protein kinase ArgK-like GTPase of G3E family